jgi:hypothetical protein
MPKLGKASKIGVTCQVYHREVMIAMWRRILVDLVDLTTTIRQNRVIAKESTRYGQNSSKTLLNSLPVDHLPDCLEILGLAVLVLQAACALAEVGRESPKHLLVGVLPSIDTEEGLELADNRVLVL